ncbi:MAG: amino acid adenylation domain-containing protein [Actinomycetota bacterium]|jgi:amino acid adenylation domain-containing protein|nr:amino acid adenylation domain-containing protein [Actinomycetota bacterium]
MSDRLVHGLLDASAEAHPEAIALEDAERGITYSELVVRARRLAHLLIDLGVSRGDRVGLYLDKQLESLVGIYGVLEAGATYVPLDPQAPPVRLAYIARDCDIRVLLTGLEKAASWEELVAGGAPLESLVVLNDECQGTTGAPAGVSLLGAAALTAQPEAAPRVHVGEDHLAYILYTSGSTGNPKGVMLSHRNALAFVDWAVERLDVRPEDRLSSHAPLHFDLSVFDLFAAAEAGATVVLVPPVASMFPPQLAQWIEDNEISVWYSVPTILSMLALRGGLNPGDLPRVRTVLFAGEVFPTKYLRTLMGLLPHARFYNLYGPTETNVCTYYKVPPLPEEQVKAIPIGKAITGVEAFAVTDDMRIAAAGEVGELYVRGPTVMHGYWDDPQKTESMLVQEPFGGDPRGKIYRTGDLVQEDEDGNFRFLGRRDSQIKSRGYRIELGDIESALVAHPGVVECAAVAIPDGLVTNRIKAFVVAREGVQAAELLRFCGDRLPAYMVPESLALRPSLTRTSTGKVDRQALKKAA